MKRAVCTGLAVVAIAFCILFGCNAVDTTTGGTIVVDSDFTDAPVSPGGTGGTQGSTVLEGTEDVELEGEQTRSFFTAFQIDPASEDTAGPKFVVAADVDHDGLLDLVSAWNQSQPVQLHLQRRDAEGTISFRTITLAGTTPIAIVAGLEVGQLNDDDGDGDIDDDDWLDVVVLVKANGFATFCPKGCPTDSGQQISNLDGEIMVLFNPGAADLVPDGDQWTEMLIINPFIADRWIHNHYPGIEFKKLEEGKTKPEWNGFVSLAVANIDGQPGDDIVVALNPGECKELGQQPPSNTVDLWINPGPGLAETSSAWGVQVPGAADAGLTRGAPLSLMVDAPQVKDIAIMDVDDDGDLDIIATWTNSLSQNIRWVRNPLFPHQPGGPSGVAELTSGSRDNSDLCDKGARAGLPCPNGDCDCIGVPAGVCTAGVCVGGKDPGADCEGSPDCEAGENGTCDRSWHLRTAGWQRRPIAQLDTGADVMSIGDVDGDGFDDIVVRSTIGQLVQWFRRPSSLVIEPEFPPNDPVPDRFNFPWPVFTLTEFDGQEPAALALGDLTGNGVLDAVISVEGGVFWYDSSIGNSLFDPWFPNTIIQDVPTDTTDATIAPGSGVGVDSVDATTHINALLIVDLDGDGKNDIVGTLDRRTGSGLSDDRLVWYRNTRDDVAP